MPKNLPSKEELTKLDIGSQVLALYDAIAPEPKEEKKSKKKGGK